MRGASALIMADHLNWFSNSSPSPIRVARDWHVLWPDLGLALASLYPDSARDPAGDLWRYLVTVLEFINNITVINKALTPYQTLMDNLNPG